MHLQIPILGAQVVNDRGDEYGTVSQIIVHSDGLVYIVIDEYEEPEDGAKEPIPFKVVSNDSVL
jgi:ribosomal 30S subunit maturation factor RimM